MTLKKTRRKLEIDLSPPNEAQKKVEAEIVAVRAMTRGMRQFIKREVDRAPRNCGARRK